MIDETGFTLKDWSESTIEVFQASDEAKADFEDLKAHFDTFCQRHNLAGILSVGMSQTKETHGVMGSTQFSLSLGRNIPEMLACDQILRRSLLSSAEYIEAVLTLDAERNIRETKKGLN